MLFVAILTMVVGYAMMYASLHGNWEFWKYLIPAKAAVPVGSPAQPAPNASVA